MIEKNSFEDVLKKYGELTYICKGTSMLPMLRPEKDIFTVVKKTEARCKENDVVLFELNGKYILHRIVEVFDDHYTILGDNCVNYEKNIKDENILGILISFQRNGQIIRTSDTKYNIYIFLLRLFEKPRIVSKKLLAACKKRIKELVGYSRKTYDD